MEKIELTEAEWRERLTPEQYHVLREAGTERAHAGTYTYNKDTGVYGCAGCGSALFQSETKFESESGWPSFTRPITPEAVTEHRDVSYGMVRVEVCCTACGGHLGHVFPDGPRADTGLRYCINSLALDFDKA